MCEEGKYLAESEIVSESLSGKALCPLLFHTYSFHKSFAFGGVGKHRVLFPGCKSDISWKEASVNRHEMKQKA